MCDGNRRARIQLKDINREGAVPWGGIDRLSRRGGRREGIRVTSAKQPTMRAMKGTAGRFKLEERSIREVRGELWGVIFCGICW